MREYISDLDKKLEEAIDFGEVELRLIWRHNYGNELADGNELAVIKAYSVVAEHKLVLYVLSHAHGTIRSTNLRNAITTFHDELLPNLSMHERLPLIEYSENWMRNILIFST